MKNVDVELALLHQTLVEPVGAAFAAAGWRCSVHGEDHSADVVPEVLVLGVMLQSRRADRFLDADPTGWWDGIEETLVSVIERLQRVSAMTAHGGGRVVLVVDDAGVCGAAERSGESAVGGAAIAMTKSLAREFSPLGVSVNAAAIQADLLDCDDGHYPLKVAQLIAFLADRELTHLTGQIVPCNRATLRTRV